MYNRYIPQEDGSYQRCHMNDQTPAAPPPPLPKEQPQETPKLPPPIRKPPQRRPSPQRQERKQEPSPISVSKFLKQLLPADFDTGDLLVVVLLLLMSADAQEDQSTALLTLAIYLFL